MGEREREREKDLVSLYLISLSENGFEMWVFVILAESWKYIKRNEITFIDCAADTSTVICQLSVWVCMTNWFNRKLKVHYALVDFCLHRTLLYICMDHLFSESKTFACFCSRYSFAIVFYSLRSENLLYLCIQYVFCTYMPVVCLSFTKLNILMCKYWIFIHFSLVFEKKKYFLLNQTRTNISTEQTNE